MLSADQKRSVHDFIHSSTEKACLKQFRTELCRLDQPHTRPEACDALLDLLLAQYQKGVERLLFTNLQEYIEVGVSLEDLEQHIQEGLSDHQGGTEPFQNWLQLHQIKQHTGNIEKRSSLRKDLTEIKKWINERISTLTPTKRVSRRRHSGRQGKKTRLSAQQLTNSRRLTLLRQEVRRGHIDLQSIEDCAAFVERQPDAVAIFQLMLILADWKRHEDGKGRLKYLNDRPVHLTLIAPQILRGLLNRFVNLQPDTIQVSAIMAAVGRLQFRDAPYDALGQLLVDHRSQADARSLGNGLWSLARAETGREYAEVLLQELVDITRGQVEEAPDKVSTVSSLWSAGVFAFDAELVAPLLDHAKDLLKYLRVSDVARCFQAAVYFDHDQAFWKEQFDANPAMMDSWYQRERENPEEQAVHSMVCSYLERHGISAQVSQSSFLFGLECDVLVTLANGICFDIESDGLPHLHKQGSDAYRDGILKALSVQTLRVTPKVMERLQKNPTAQEAFFQCIREASEISPDVVLMDQHLP